MSYDYSWARENVARDLRAHRVEQTPEAISRHAMRDGAIPPDEAREFTVRFLRDLSRGLDLARTRGAKR